jgi:hypothetical protein
MAIPQPQRTQDKAIYVVCVYVTTYIRTSKSATLIRGGPPGTEGSEEAEAN